MTTARDHLNKADTMTIAALEEGVPVVQAGIVVARFHAMIRKPNSTFGTNKRGRV